MVTFPCTQKRQTDNSGEIVATLSENWQNRVHQTIKEHKAIYFMYLFISKQLPTYRKIEGIKNSVHPSHQKRNSTLHTKNVIVTTLALPSSLCRYVCILSFVNYLKEEKGKVCTRIWLGSCVIISCPSIRCLRMKH